MSKHSANRCLVAAVVLLLGTCLGCGTRQYEKRLEETVKRLGQESAFTGMHPPAQLPGTQVMVQLPQFFDPSPLPEDTDPGRLKLPSIEVPDLKFTYEGSITDSEGGKIPFYCYLASSEKDPQRRLQQQFQTAFPEKVVRWEEVDCKAPDGGTRKWKRLQGAGKQQKFYYRDKEQNGEFRDMATTSEFYLRQEGNFFVVIGWRVPTDIEKYMGPEGDRGLAVWAPRVAGSVTVK